MLLEKYSSRVIPLDYMPTSAELKKELPLISNIASKTKTYRKQIEEILCGKDNRLLVIIGPCSIHDIGASLDYANRLFNMKNMYDKELFIVMRTYFSKPHSILGWKGLFTDPNLDGSYDLKEGVSKARKLLLDVSQIGLPTATEFLEPFLAQYISDLVCWGTIGARTVESQIHRELASSLAFPIGFKNGTSGSVQVAMDAIQASSHSHHFCTLNEEGKSTVYKTAGNKSGHIILSGGDNGANYSNAHIEEVCNNLLERDLKPRVIVDFNHRNSREQHKNQIEVSKNICEQIACGNGQIAGVMVKGFIKGGHQVVSERKNLSYGQSISDPCLSWDETERLLARLADAVKKSHQIEKTTKMW